MRRADDVRQREQRTISCRLADENIERRSGDVAGFKRLEQSGFVDQAAACAIDQPNALLRQCQAVGADDVAGLLGERSMQRHEIGAL